MEKGEQIIKHTKYEIARMIGSRALQISMGAPFLVKLEKKDLEAISYNPVEIAKMEFAKDVLPITIKRPFPKARNVPPKEHDKQNKRAED